jgi:hypothetical protein
MKLIILFVLLALGNLQYKVYSQERDYIFNNIPGSSRKAEMIVISGPPYVPVFYCKVNGKVYHRKSYVKDNNIEFQWGFGYVELNDSLRLIDFFDNHKLDNLSLFGGVEKSTQNESAVYYKLKKKIFKPDYKIKKKEVVIARWWNDDFKPYEKTFVPVGPKFKW